MRVDALLEGPGGARLTQPCFWRIPQERHEVVSLSTERGREVPWERFRATGPGRWGLRASPPATGRWRWRWQVTLADGAPRELPGGEVEVTAPPLARIAMDESGFRGADGRAWIPVGHNCAWPVEDGAAGWERWIDRLADAGGDATRLWLVHYYGGTALEWSRSGMNDGYVGAGRYSAEAAERVDRLIASAEARGVRVMVCLWTFGDFAWDWPKNPYARTAGGWLGQPAEFFTDARAQTSARAVLRYAAARWGASPSLWAWELWNEVDTVTGFDDRAVAAWHAQMTRELRRVDAHARLVTTSYRFTPPQSACGAYALEGIAFAQLHSYWPAIADAVAEELPRLDAFAKPAIVGEFGLHVEPASLAADRAGLHLHDGLWSGLFAGGASGGFGWWWDTWVDAHGLWPHLGGLARFVRGESLAGMQPAPATTAGGASALALAGPDRAWAWVRAPRAIAVAGRGPELRVTALHVPAHDAARSARIAVGGDDGWWRIDWIDPYDGAWLGAAVAPSAAGMLTAPLPTWRHDVALKARRVAASEPPVAGPPQATPWHDTVAGWLEAARRVDDDQRRGKDEKRREKEARKAERRD